MPDGSATDHQRNVFIFRKDGGSRKIIGYYGKLHQYILPGSGKGEKRA